MCDTFVALGPATRDGAVIFGKNSDREPNEAHELVAVPAAEHPAGATVRCTHITIPQARRTHRVFLAKPYWIWGAEMGANSHGVVIGNEALFNKHTKERAPGLIGMDLLRLGLERARSAADAVAVISELLERYGQSGQAGHSHDFQYDNSFLVADPAQAWILETFGRQWVARQVTESDSISNGLTTRGHWDLASATVGAPTGDMDLAKQHAEPVYTTFAAAGSRQCRTADGLAARRGEVDITTAMDLLSDHGDASPDWTPARALIGQDICMHAGFGPVRSSQTTGSMIAHVGPAGTTLWVTGTAAPCTSTFKPVWLDVGLPDLGPRPGRTFDGRSLWWRHELLHRTTLLDYARRMGEYRGARDMVNRNLVLGVPEADAPAAERAEASAAAFRSTARHEQEWLERIRSMPRRKAPDRLLTLPYRKAWAGWNDTARLPVL